MYENIPSLSSYTHAVKNKKKFEEALYKYANIVNNARYANQLLGKQENIESHIIDSISPLPYFFKVTDNILKHTTNTTITLADLGTGAGLPGIPLALGFGCNAYSSTWYLVERSQKKINFLTHAIESLQEYLTSTTIHIVPHTLQEWTSIPQIHITTARAFRPFKAIKKELQKINKDTVFLFYKGKKSQIMNEFTPWTSTPPLITIKDIVTLTHEPEKERHIVTFTWQ